MKKILILTSSFEFNLDMLSDYSLNYNKFNRKLTESELIDYLDEHVIGVIAGLEPYNSRVLNYAPNLKVISRCGAGMDNISEDLFNSNKIKIYSTPDAPTKSVVELTLGLTLSLLRTINTSDKSIKNGVWKRTQGSLLSGKTFGIIGLGRIGQGVAKLVSSFGAKVTYHDNSSSHNDEYESLPLTKLLEQSDIISIHLPYDETTKNILSSNRLALLKPTAFVINTSRGGLLDETALYNLLKDNRIAGAALDVFESEPYYGPLINLPNVILTPHIGSFTKEGRRKQEEEAINNLLKGLSEHK